MDVSPVSATSGSNVVYVVLDDGDLQSFHDDVVLFNRSVVSLSSVSGTTSESNVPDDFYDYMADVVGQCAFFISICMGMLLFLCFSRSFK